MKVLTQKNIMNMFPVVMLIKLFVLMIDLVSQLLFMLLIVKLLTIKNAAYEFIKATFQEYKYCRKIMKKHFQ